MREDPKRSALATEMIQLIETAMSPEKLQGLYAEMPALLETESNDVVVVLIKWLICLQGTFPGSIVYASQGYVHPAKWFAFNTIVVYGFRPHGLYRVSEDGATLGLSLKGLRLAFESDHYTVSETEQLYTAAHIRNAVRCLIHIHQHPRLSGGTIV